MELLDSRIRIRCIFGRAGFVSAANSQFKNLLGAISYWSSVPKLQNIAYDIFISATKSYPNYDNDATPFGNPLRCLAHGTAG